jgi:prepilin-type N-terminal cleavage/methylation domain-containing protein
MQLPPQPGSQTNHRGFSALELILALFVAALVAAGTLTLLGQRYKSSTQTRAMLAATTEARRTLDTVTSMASAAGNFEQLRRGLLGNGGPLAGAVVEGDVLQGGRWTATALLPSGLTRKVVLQGPPPQDALQLLTLTISVTAPQLPSDVTLTTRVMP